MEEGEGTGAATTEGIFRSTISPIKISLFIILLPFAAYALIA